MQNYYKKRSGIEFVLEPTVIKGVQPSAIVESIKRYSKVRKTRKRTSYQKIKIKIRRRTKETYETKGLTSAPFPINELGSQSYYNRWWKLRCWKLCNVWSCLQSQLHVPQAKCPNICDGWCPGSFSLDTFMHMTEMSMR